MMVPTAFAIQDPGGLDLVDSLPALRGDIAGYREQMRRIGQHLGESVLSVLGSLEQDREICIVCTVEDADFLGRGLIEALEKNGLGDRIRLLCLWNESIRQDGVSLSPISKQYREELSAEGKPIFIVVKSIISGACVVKTNLLRALSQAEPARILVAAPVLLEGAEDRLRDEFPPTMHSRFEFVHFTTHTERNGENVVPGIGGSIYELLGLGDKTAKNKYLPELVRERRRRFFAAIA